MTINLKKILAQSDTIIFVGSGISLWSGLPTWGGMIEKLAQFLERGGGSAELVRSEASRGDLLQAASYGFDKLTKQQIGEFIREACLYGVAKPHLIHKKIVSLGPRCFITTNYDNLLEESLRTWQPDRFYGLPITNRQLTATAGIVLARATDFVFKPHGDAGDIESIILTREQYRQLLPQGENQAALESLKILLASRPVLYLGFGLRDPDFMYVRDLLANIYKGGVRDHYAIMADVHEQEVDYWRNNYGIHLVGYKTLPGKLGSRDHSSLLELLDTLLQVPKAQPIPIFDPESASTLLSLARHAAILSRYSICEPEFPIRVRFSGGQRKMFGSGVYPFSYSLVETLLDSGPERLVLTGLPGAGKSYSLRRAAAKLADQLNNVCLSDSLRSEDIVVPIFVDLKLYKGDLNALVSQLLPESLPFNELIKSYKVKIFIDSFNEMPREYLESGSYEADFISFIALVGKASIIIGSRTTDGLSRLELPTFRLDYIERKAVVDLLLPLGINFEGRFSAEVLRLIQRPFYFQYILSGKIELPVDAHPRDFYRCLFENVSVAFFERFQFNLDLEKALSSAAYAALDKGSEAFLISIILNNLSGLLPSSSSVAPLDIANWLVSESILIPYSKGRIGFVHQSVTEYLAATELARRYTLDPGELRDKLSLRRWDQALFLTLSFLSDYQSKDFIADVMTADMALAINASKYIESGRDQVVSELLTKVYELKSDGVELGHMVESALDNGLHVSDVHEPLLRRLINFGDSIGGTATTLLVSIRGESIKAEVIQMLYQHRADFNFCYNAADAIVQYVTDEDITSIASLSDLVQSEVESGPNLDEDGSIGFCIALGKLLGSLDLSIVLQGFPVESEGGLINKFRGKILCHMLGDHVDTASLLVAGDLLLKGLDNAVSAIGKIAVFSVRNKNLSWGGFNRSHVSRLKELIEDTWVVDALKIMCAASSDIAEYLKEEAALSEGLLKAALLYCVDPKSMEPVFSELEQILALDEKDRKKVSFVILSHVDLDWLGKEELFVRLLRTKDFSLIDSVIGSSLPVRIRNLELLDLGDLTWWLEWMQVLSVDRANYWFLFRLGDVLANHTSTQSKPDFLNKFNSEPKYRQVILDFILQRMDLTTDVIEDDAVSFLLADLSRQKNFSLMHLNFLGAAATENFIAERLLPLLLDAQGPLKENLLSTLEQAGSRHGRRYLLENRLEQ
ncbi:MULTISPECIES: SIR2 family NAD-dependent protein deacylase [Pseudomonas]|uniref:SIR2 family NAD-dependent protein deacylase n=1 Tax=Pseudomonas TaxID=286 RepID=UPI001AE49CC8|nr:MULTISPECIES: SIR2 family protein [unclassified Pseudomonas]MBP1087042.1 hypothetical protein [Pseudomonas sp. PvP007]MBP1197125.1 hypothetical protein [Pseudomonas sp. PvP100]